MEQLTMVSLADKLSAQHDIIISDKQTINVADIFEQIDNLHLSLIHISEPTRLSLVSRMPSSA